MKFSDEQLMAFADDELRGEERATIEAAMTNDPEIATRIERYRAQRDLLRRSFEDVLNEPVPERLANAARTAPMRAADVVGLEGARAARTKPPPRSWAWPQWTAIAASLLVGLIIGQTMLLPRNGMIVAGTDGGLIAAGDLAVALTHQPSGEVAPIAIGLSYRAKSGEYCRTFTTTRAAPLAGIACREGNAWDVRVLTEVNAPATAASEYRMAGAELPPILLQAVEAQIAGSPLAVAEENAARRTEWRD